LGKHLETEPAKKMIPRRSLIAKTQLLLRNPRQNVSLRDRDLL
jgi:hypothetical protein